MAETEHALRPIEIINRTDVRVLEIAWPEGKRQKISHQLLRTQCRCADCKAMQENEKVDGTTVSLIELRLVGAYGVQLFFSDGHNRGIYPWSYLRDLRAD